MIKEKKAWISNQTILVMSSLGSKEGKQLILKLQWGFSCKVQKKRKEKKRQIDKDKRRNINKTNNYPTFGRWRMLVDRKQRIINKIKQNSRSR